MSVEKREGRPETKGERLICYLLRKYHSADSERFDPDPIKNGWMRNSKELWEIETMSDELFDKIISTPANFNRSEIVR